MRTALDRFVWMGLLALVAATGSTLSAADQPNSKAAETILALEPFKVMAEWIQIRPTLHRDGNVVFITITEVRPRTPAAAAGIKAGAILVTVQGVNLRGLTLSELDNEFRKMPAGEWLELGVADPPKLGGDEQKSLRVVRLPWKKPALAIDPSKPLPRPRPAIVKQQQMRPAIIAENTFSAPRIGSTSVDAKWANHGAYLQRMIDNVQIQWERLILQQAEKPTVGSVVSVKFTINDEGKIVEVTAVDSTADEAAKRACVRAITDRAPFGPWTDDMKAALGSRQVMTFTFHYQ